MNLHEVEQLDCDDILARSEVLTTWLSTTALIVHVIRYAGDDALLIVHPVTGKGIVIETDNTNYGGSIHEHARAAQRAGTL